MKGITDDWVHHTHIINELIERTGAGSYLEIGCGSGSNFSSIRCRQKVSVDPAEGQYSSARPTHRMTSDAFFESNLEKFDVIFIDGLHHEDQVGRDLRNALIATTQAGVVVCHDLNPGSEAMQAVPRTQREWTGDGWKAWIKLRNERPDLAMVVVDADYGVGLILVGCPPGPVLDPVPAGEMTWTNFQRNRGQWLNLREPRMAREFVMERLAWRVAGRAQDADSDGNSRARVAVIFHGLVHRSLRHVAASLRKNLIQPFERLSDVDIFFHSWDVSEINNPRAGEHGAVVDIRDVEEFLPEARGQFEPQDEFDATVDWERLFRKNPMRNCCGSEEEARTTLMNFRRALESQERAWRFFERRREKHYRAVVAARPDLRFPEELVLPAGLVTALFDGEANRRELEGLKASWKEEWPAGGSVSQVKDWTSVPPMLWLPDFHAWGGVNDRFAVGNHEAIRIWSNRAGFAEEWLLRANDESAEWLLMKWLEKNRVRVGFMDVRFQRIRANGEVDKMDRGLPPARAGSGKKRGAERFLVIAREAGKLTENLARVLHPLGKVEVISDRPLDGDSGPGTSAPAGANCDHFHLTDDESAGYAGLMSESFPRITAWSRAFAHLAQTLGEEEAVWFVEDDVAGDPASFAELVAATSECAADLSALSIRTRQEAPNWTWWKYAEGIFANPRRAFQPLCRLSRKLVCAVLEFQKQHERLTFHEVLFASLVEELGMSWLDWQQDERTKSLVSQFRYRPEVEVVRRGVCHPVKKKELHEAICGQVAVGGGRRAKAACEGWSIFPDDYDFLASWFRRQGFKCVVEFGPGDSTLALLDAGCRVVSYEHDIEWLRRTLGRFRSEADVEILHCPEGCLPDLLEYRPDMVFVDGPPYRQGQRMSRLGTCEWALEACGAFLLHDANRAAERATLAEMERRGMQVIPLATKKGLALVVDPALRPELLQDLSDFYS